MDIDAIFLLKMSNVVLFNVRKAFFQRVDVRQRPHQLQHIEVTGNEAGFDILLGRF